MKDVSPAAVYVALIPLLMERARKCGYALAVHGSLARDLDLIAAPWTEEAVSGEALVLELLAAGGWTGAHLLPESTDQEGKVARKAGSAPDAKPHGRLAWSIHFNNGLYIDVSVMPRAAALSSPDTSRTPEAEK